MILGSDFALLRIGGKRMGKQIYGYIRVSTVEQNIDRQQIALAAFGVSPENIFVDKVSGKDFDRPEWKRLMKALRRDDLVVVKSVDRLGRNYEEMIEQWRLITKKKQADIYVLDMPVLDTRGKRDLMGTLIADIVLVVMSFFAQSEREAIRQRQAEGIAAARAKGKHLGLKPMEPPPEFPQVREEWAQGKLSARKAAKKLGVSNHTFAKWTKKTAGCEGEPSRPTNKT